MVIPGRAEGASPESIDTKNESWKVSASNELRWLWIPGSPLRGAPE
jgi:hypothetical protein